LAPGAAGVVATLAMNHDVRVVTAIYAGSFDPVHLGHLGVIEDAAAQVDRLWVVVAGNPAKRTGLLPLDQRRLLIERSTSHLPNVGSVIHDGLIVDIAERLGADRLVRGAGKEYRFEVQMSATNSALSGIETLFVTPRASTRHISSSSVRDIFAAQGADAVADLVPAAVIASLRASV
jgi:pantetheine-phosphate adenylyltransferase